MHNICLLHDDFFEYVERNEELLDSDDALCLQREQGTAAEKAAAVVKRNRIADELVRD